jgi:O-antigen ligase
MAKKKRSGEPKLAVNKSNHGNNKASVADASFDLAASSMVQHGGDYAAQIASMASASASTPASGAASSQAATKPRVLLPLPGEIGKGDWTAIILCLMIFFTPALGVPHEMMLQDTLKSIIVAFMSLGAALLLFWRQRNRRDALRWHFIMWLPLGLCAYALGSMVWAHTFLAGVEAIRWFLFALIVWLVLNCITRERVPMLAWSIHLGALAVALLGAAQFWFDVRFIPQGPNPAATFVNRNFAAEFVCTTLVFSAWLILRERRTGVLAFLAATTAFHIIFLMMCGTRSALVASYISFAFIAVLAWRFRKQLAFQSWQSNQRIVVPGVMLAVLLGLGFIKSGNPSADMVGLSPFERVVQRTAAIGAGQATFQVRRIMWVATLNIMQKRPLTGVGAGTWEADIPLYQAEGAQLETDYYTHNEFLQILGEFGLVGWLFLLGLITYSVRSAWQVFRAKTEQEHQEGLIRAVALTSLLALMVVSNIGFPWRLATTGVMFALCLGLLAASDARLAIRGWLGAQRLGWRPGASQTAAVVTVGCLALATYISYKAAECEQKIVQSVKMALSISASGDPNNPRFDKTKREMLQLAREGIAINPHYRKITPMLGDELAKWGDWKNAIWVWESVLGSRPYVAAIASNIARGYLAIGQNDKALDFLEKAKKVQPKGVSVRSLEVILLARSGKETQALEAARRAFTDNTMDFDMMNSLYVLSVRASDFPLAIQALEKRNEIVPSQAVDGYLKIANIYDSYVKDEEKAVQAFRKAYQTSKSSPQVLSQIPQVYHARVAAS